MQPPARFPEIGEKLANRFRVVFGRGSGPNGMVFKALDLALDLPVAIKVFKPGLFASPYKDQNLLRLYRARAYQDPNLIKIFEVQEDRGFHFISCQLMEGMSLAAVLDLHAESGEHFTIPKVRAIMTRILTGLEAIHKTGAIHGNLKPQNIFVLPDRLVLTDPYYLVVQPLQEGEEIPVWDYYRGPEQLTDPSLEMAQTDLYAAALIFGEIVGGNPVKAGIPLSAQIPRLTTRFDDWFIRATAMDPLQRPRTLAEFREPLLGLLDVVESEGMWQRRYHETGSFRAIRVALPREEAIRPVEPPPEPVRVEKSLAEAASLGAAMPLTPEPIPEPPPEAIIEEMPVEPRIEAAPEPAPETQGIAAEAAAVPETPEAVARPTLEVAPEPAPETEGIAAEAAAVPETPEAVARPTLEAAPEPEPETVEIAAVEPVLEEEGILVSPEPEAVEETIEGIEVLSDEVPPLPAEAAAEEGSAASRPTEAFFPEDLQIGARVREEAAPVEAPPLPPQTPATSGLPEATGDTLEMERVVQPPPTPTARMAPMQRVAGVGEAAARPGEKPEGAPVRSFLLLLTLFVVVGGVATIAVLWFGSETPESPPAPPVAVEAPRPPAPIPAPAVTPAPAPRDVPAAAVPDTAQVADAGAQAVAPSPPPPPTPPPPKRTLAQVLKCPDGMAKVVLDPNAPDDADPKKVAFCIATHEYPGAGQKPKVGVSAGAAKAACAKEGKRLCTGDEWRAACGEAYPYGGEYREGACNVTSGALKESGSFPDCKTSVGVFDLVGNASEWAADGRVHGGDVSGGADNRCDTWSKRLMPGPTNGFRCCADATR